MKVIAIIPALNESKHIAGVVKATRKYVDSVLVMDGGSDDATTYLAREAGADVKQGRYGLGANLMRGLNFAISRRPDVIVLLDGDGQHNAAEIPDLLKPIRENRADVVVGNRLAVRGMPPYRIFGNGILSAAMNYQAKQQFKDSMVGFWAIKREALPKLTEKGWGVYIEMLVKIRGNGHRLTSVPIQPIYHPDYRDNSSLPPFDLGVRLLWFILKWRLKVEVLKHGNS